MSFTDAIKTCFRRYFQISGRASRPEFWWWFVFLLLVQFLTSFLLGPFPFLALVNTFISFFLYVPTITVTMRRFHDMNRSGLWALLWLLPYAVLAVDLHRSEFVDLLGPLMIVGQGVVLIWCSFAGTTGPNRFDAGSTAGPPRRSRSIISAPRTHGQMSFAVYALRRVVHAALFLLILLVLLIFVGDQSDPAGLLGQGATPETMAAFRREFGLDRPLAARVGEYIEGFLRWDLGVSMYSGRAVADLIADRFAVTMTIVVLSSAVAVPLAFFGALWVAAMLQHRRPVLAVARLSPSTPAFLPAFVLIYVVAIQLGWLPAIAFVDRSDVWSLESLHRLTLPICSVVISIIGSLLLIAHADLTESPKQARHQKDRRKQVALVTLIGQAFSLSFVASFFVEIVFSAPGLGRLLLDSMLTLDHAVMLAVTMIIAATLITINLLTDLAQYAVGDRGNTALGYR